MAKTIGLQIYAPTRPALRLSDFPDAIQPLASRSHLAGNGSKAAPFVMGWSVRAVGPGSAVSQKPHCKDWLQEQGFTLQSGRWQLRDDVWCEASHALAARL